MKNQEVGNLIYYRVAPNIWDDERFSVQVWRFWWPFWTQIGDCGFDTREQACACIQSLRKFIPGKQEADKCMKK